MVQYGSFAAERGGPVAPEDTWAEMKDSTEEVRARSGGSVKVYATVAVVAIAVIIFACIQLSSGSSSAASAVDAMPQLHQAEPVTTSETGVQSSKVVRAAHQRLHLKTIMTSPAIHWAQNYLIEQVAQWARTHPTKPGHEGMVQILEKDPSKYKPIVQSLVVKKLTNPRDCDVHNVCEANPVAEQIRSKVCPPGSPCGKDILDRIDHTADWAAKISTDGAFHGLLQQMKHPPPAPLHNFGQSGQSAGAVSAKTPPPPGGAWQTPGANTAW
jgi:hypothetical protein